ncbi:unnamed protein product [Rotaria socialis]|uniref:non-specific protein-tyrosine kinase n=2 Tax=Rotaria socialis TaxID=392032 RepID=A0A818AHP4_9BILA|nr:unnamed protein product [Rotaria socialis]
MKMTSINDDSSSNFGSSIISDTYDCFIDVPGGEKQSRVLKNERRQVKTSCESKPHERSHKNGSTSSYESHTSLGSTGSNSESKAHSLTLTIAQAEDFRKRIEIQYDILQRSEAVYCYYIYDRSASLRAREKLQDATDGTFFIRAAEESKRTSNVEYFLNFVCHKQVVEVPICCDKARRAFWFLSGYGHGSEVKREYTGIDVLVQHKKENIFHELQYPFRISLYKPIDPSISECIPLPDEVRGMGSQSTILHELAVKGLSSYFNELIRISRNDLHPLQKKALCIVNKINGKNKQGHTPLILAINAKKYEFVELLLDHKADVNINDSDGFSPLHHACRQGHPRILKKLIDRHADPHYFNPRENPDGSHQSNLAAFHNLAMSNGVTQKNIRQCAMLLVEHGCPLIPLTREGKTPFDIAQMYQNNAYECIKMLCNRYQFNYLNPIEVSSRNEAKTILNDLACPNWIGKIRLHIKKADNRDCFKNEGLFLLYKTKQTKSKPTGELGLCVHHNGQVFVYIITQKHSCIIKDSTNLSDNIFYKYSLITDTIKDDQAQTVVFQSCEELVYNHTKRKGTLPTLLEEFVRKNKDETETMKAKTLLLPVKYPPHPSYGIIPEDPEIEDDRDISSINHIDLFQIYSAKILDEKDNRLIWLTKCRVDNTISIPVIIKDYLPETNIDSYKQYRLNELNNSSHHETANVNDEFPYGYNSRRRLEYKHESEILLEKLKNDPFIIHAFICDHNLKRDLRIFMEYLPMGNLHSYLKRLDQGSLDPLINAFHWIYQLAQAMAFLSNNKIVHRDLAARNILLQNEKHIKLSDFGLARFEDEKIDKNDNIVPARWSAPECFDRTNEVSSLSDVWSFGIVIWEIYSFGALPYEIETNNNSQPLIHLLKRFLVEQNRRLSRPQQCSQSVYDLMARCWNGDRHKRPHFVDIINELNGANFVKNCIVSFTREERKAWKVTEEEYIAIRQRNQHSVTNDNHYISVTEHENNEENILL